MVTQTAPGFAKHSHQCNTKHFSLRTASGPSHGRSPKQNAALAPPSPKRDAKSRPSMRLNAQPKFEGKGKLPASKVVLKPVVVFSRLR
jgi:hypothetical protein